MKSHKCERCDAEYFSYDKRRKYCSLVCYRKTPKTEEYKRDMSIKLMGKNNGRKRPDTAEMNRKLKSRQLKGRPNIKLRKTGRSVYRRWAIELFGKSCQRCGKSDGRIEVHHKDENRDNNPMDGSNWEVLCRSCHFNEHNIIEKMMRGRGLGNNL